MQGSAVKRTTVKAGLNTEGSALQGNTINKAGLDIDGSALHITT